MNEYEKEKALQQLKEISERINNKKNHKTSEDIEHNNELESNLIKRTKALKDRTSHYKSKKATIVNPNRLNPSAIKDDPFFFNPNRQTESATFAMRNAEAKKLKTSTSKKYINTNMLSKDGRVKPSSIKNTSRTGINKEVLDIDNNQISNVTGSFKTSRLNVRKSRSIKKTE